MKKNSPVFSLIKSLTMSEKRYFKIFSERHTIGTENKYVALFDQLDKMANESDVELKLQLEKLKVKTAFLSADKNYLYNLILRSLNDFHDSRTYNLEIKKALLSIEILFQKGLYHDCLKLIDKTELLAEACENFQLCIDLMMWKKKCSGYSLGLKKAAEVNHSIDRYLMLLNNLKKITDLYYESNILQANNEKQSKKEVIKKLEAIFENKELRSEKQALSFSAKIFFHLIYSNYYYVLDNKKKEYEQLQKLVDLLNSSKIYATENPMDYISIYNRLLSIKKFFPSSSFFNDIKVLNEFSKQPLIRKEVVLQRVFVHTNTHELEYYLINNNFDLALQKTKDIDKNLFKLDLDIESYHLIYFYYMQAITLIFLGQFRKALTYINKALHDFNAEDRPQVYMRLELLNAVVHFELKNYSLVPNLLKQCLKKGKEQQLISSIEVRIFDALIEIASTKHLTAKIEQTIFNSLYEQIMALRKLHVNENNSLLENYYKWVSAKVKKRFVSELF